MKLPANNQMIRWMMVLLCTSVVGLEVESTAIDAFEGYRVGAASRVVNPALDSFLAGYDLDRRVTGYLDDIFVKAVVISDPSTSLVIITIDNIGLTRPDIETLQQLVAEPFDQLIPKRVIVSSTHTHSGPDVVGLWGENLWSSGRNPEYIERLVNSAVAAVTEAKAREISVTSRSGSWQLPLNWVNNRSEPQLLDDTLSLLQFIDAAGNSVATLTNYACHPTVLGATNTLASADYVSAFYTSMSEKLPGEHLFLQGAIGGWVQPVELSEGGDAFRVMNSYGRELAQRTLELLATAADNPYTTLKFASSTFDVELENWGFRVMMWLGVLDRELFRGKMRTSAAWFRIGDAEFVTHPGETSPAYSLQSRQLMQSDTTFVLGLTQDAMGYILKPEYFADEVNIPHAEYLTSVSVGPTAGPTLMRVLERLIP